MSVDALEHVATPAASVKDALIERVCAFGYDALALRMNRHE
ncbi:hypothetical protein [Paraburkholderia xenovorans]